MVDRVGHWHIESTPNGVARARDAATAFARDAGMTDGVDDVALVVSELVANAVLHGRPPVELNVTIDDQGPVHIEVGDTAPGRPQRRSPEPTSPSGRGLLIVDAVAAQWGCTDAATGKVVWATCVSGDTSTREPQPDVGRDRGSR